MRSLVSQQSSAHRKHEKGTAEKKERRQRSRQRWSHGKSAPTVLKRDPTGRGSLQIAHTTTTTWLSPWYCMSQLCSCCKVSNALLPFFLSKGPSLENSIYRAIHRALHTTQFCCCCFHTDSIVLSPSFQSCGADRVLSSSWFLNPGSVRPTHLPAAGSILEMGNWRSLP